MAATDVLAPSTADARERLLEAAAACFAARGFKDASVREITAAAGCNVAAVNYHFGDKDSLYRAVFRQRLAELRTRRVGVLNALLERESLSLEDVLRAFASAFLQPLTEESRGQLTVRLIMRDMVEGHLPRQMILDEMIRPTQQALLAALHAACPRLPAKDALMCVHSLVAQLVHLLRVQELFAEGDAHDGEQLDLGQAVEHIVRFSAAGVREYAGP